MKERLIGSEDATQERQAPLIETSSSRVLVCFPIYSAGRLANVDLTYRYLAKLLPPTYRVLRELPLEMK
jgi:hypothetical protein